MQNFNSISEVLSAEVKDNRTPGVQYHLFNTDKIIFSHHEGHSKVEEKEPVGNNTTFHAFSITKTFTALAILQLQERGLLTIDEPVRKYIQDFPYEKDASIRQVMNHTSGIPNPIPLSWIHTEEEHKLFDKDAFLDKILAKHNKPVFKAGSKFAYTNLGYIILGRLIERVSGKIYEEFIIQNIIQKLGINTADLSFTVSNRQMHARGYHKNLSISNLVLGMFIDKKKFMGPVEGSWKSFNPFYVNGTAYGGLVGNPLSFIRYIQELLKDDCSLVSPELKAELFKENVLPGSKSTGMCLSWFAGKLHDEPYYAHAGGGGGYYIEIRLYPERKLGSVIFFNRSGMRDERFLDRTDKSFI